MSIQDNIQIIEENIEKALRKSGREGEKVELIAVTKTVDINRIKNALDYGIINIGENRVQELELKYNSLGDKINYHMIGHLQTNKVKNIINKTRLVHSLDRLSLAKEIDRRSKNEGIVTEVLLQVNVAEEETKFGLKLNEVLNFLEDVLVFDNIKVRGLMTIAPHVNHEETLRNIFKTLYNLKEDIKSRNYKELSMDYLSMGMSNDYELAIEEGSNMIRVGSNIFGKRNY
ncbi:YggS family pyridoxal phosphate-dependent enzyme [Tissierella pigra]|nr:YggS family pyridoxal phosphate-dependent enzyme [Tissierella pigra]